MHIRSSAVAFVAAAAFFIGCEDSSSGAPAPAASSQRPMDPELSSASTQTMTAFQALFQQERVDASNPMGSSRASLQQANATLRSEWNADKSDSRVAFGLAVTTLALRLNELAGTMERASANGLPIGGAEVATRTSPMDIEGQFAIAARTMATPAKAPIVHELQDSLEQRLLPVLDEAIELLSVSWGDAAFEFHVAIDPVEFPEDTLIIDRSDVGFALSILQALRAEVRWIVSYNADIDQNGSYAWIDTLGNVDDIAVLTSAQNAALQHVESLLSNGSSFLKVRAGKEALLASVPVELRAALQRVRESAVLAYSLKAGGTNRLQTIATPAVRDSFLRVVDSGIAWMSGTRDIKLYSVDACRYEGWGTDPGVAGIQRVTSTARFFDILGFIRRGNYEGTVVGPDYTESYSATIDADISIDDFSCDTTYDQGDSTYEWHVRTYRLPSRSTSIRMNLSNLLALNDLKVFLPRFQWNPTASWKASGPISLVDASGIAVPLPDVIRLGDSLGYEGVKNSITWADPSFGGVFPQFKTSQDIMTYYRDAIESDGAASLVAARGPLPLL